MTFELRPYQTEALNKLREALRAGRRRLVLYSPTGSGKTEMGIEIIRGAEAKGKRALFIANRIQIVGQTSRRLHKSRLRHGIIQGANTSGSWERTLVCSIQTLASRGFPDDIGLIIIDEAHATAGTEAYRELIEHAKVPVIGLTATPFTRGMGKHYDSLGGPLYEEIVVAATIQDLIGQGFLVDVDIYAPSEPDLRGVKIVAGDYHEKQLGQRVDQPKLIGDIVEHWQRLGGDRQTVCFATNIAHSKHIVEEFLKAGVRAEHMDAYTSDEDRASILRRFGHGDTRVLSNVAVLAEGWDCPAAEVLILARPTRSLTRYIQMAGRVLRPHAGKHRALILDHSGTCVRLGFPTDDLPLELDDGRPQPKNEQKDREREEKLPHPCPKCHYMIPAGVFKCPSCGHEHRPPTRVGVSDGKLVKLEKATKESKQSWYSQLLHIQRERKKKPHWVDHLYKSKFGVWPRGMVEKAAPPSQDVLNFVKSRQIAYAKRMEKQNAEARP